MWKHWWFWVAVVVVIGVIGSAAGLGKDDTENRAAAGTSPTGAVQSSATLAAPTETSSPEPTEAPSPEARPEPKPIQLHGTGHQATKTFDLVGGFTTFHVKASGSSNVIVYLVNDRGKKIELLVNVIGSYDGVSGIGVKPGEYLLDIDAPSSWSIEIEQPRPTSGKSPPQSYSGTQPDVLGPLQLDGLVRLVMKYSGNSNFIVYLLNDRGQPVDLAANEIGDFSGSTAESGSGGVYWITVDADGKWSIKVQ